MSSSSSTWRSCRLALRWGSGWPGGSSANAAALASRLSVPSPRPLSRSSSSSCGCLWLRRRRRGWWCCLGGWGPSQAGLWLRGLSWPSSRAPPPPPSSSSKGLARGLGTHPKKEPIEALNTAQGARDFIYSLHATERSCLLRELHRFESIAIAQACESQHIPFTESIAALFMPREERQFGEKPRTVYTEFSIDGSEAQKLTSEKLEVAPPSTGQLKHVFFHNAIPFVGFGFFDNAIMIAAGTQIELSIGIVLGISTMAAAALGNLVSDLAGLGLAGYIEAMASRLGLSIPDLTPKQADMWQTRLSAHLGKAIGVTIGCLFGMFPLFFLGDEEEKKLEGKK